MHQLTKSFYQMILQAFLIAWYPLAGSMVLSQETPEQNPLISEKAGISKYTFKHAKAADVLRLMNQLAGFSITGFAVDERTNSLIFLVESDVKPQEMEDFFKLLDTESPSPSPTGNGSNGKGAMGIPALGPKPVTLDFSFLISAEESIDSLQTRYRELETQAHRLADKLKQSESVGSTERSELQAAVRKSFEARQALQRAELADLAKRMKSMQQSIDLRDKLAEKVIERRVEDLLDPNLKWEVDGKDKGSPLTNSPKETPTPSNTTTAKELQAALQGTWQVRVFQAEDGAGDERISLVVIRGDLLLFHTIVNGKVLGVSPFKLEWSNSEKPFEVGVIWNPNDVENNSAMRGLIAYDGQSFQLVYGENPVEVCPGDGNTYIDCVRSSTDVPLFVESNAKLDKPETIASPQPMSLNGAAATPRIAGYDWDSFIEQMPETGTALVMFSYEAEAKQQMLPIASKVAEKHSAKLIELPMSEWRKVVSPEATHFVLMKDRQLVGTRTGLMTERRLEEFVAKANGWLTPRSTGIKENSLVRIDCYINPGPNNIGSQHGGAFAFTTAVVATHEDEALLLGPESIANYIDSGYACVAVITDENGKPKQLPMDVILSGPVKLPPRSAGASDLEGSVQVKNTDGTSSNVQIASLYPESFTKLLDTYDVGTAIYHIRGAHGLTTVRLATDKATPSISQPVLSGGFARERSFPPIHGFNSPIHWQTQTVQGVGAVYGDNINGAEMFKVLCPTRPTPFGFTFTEQGDLLGMYGLGAPTAEDMTHEVFQPYVTHAVLQAALEKIDDADLKAALTETVKVP
ncbi:MAG: hypothetical protein J0M26_12260 [Planctomycetes bacterium]|nr:hypothetical protein [Planctomycetota bacterium]